MRLNRLFLLLPLLLLFAASAALGQQTVSDETSGDALGQTENKEETAVVCGSVDLVILIDTTFSLATAIGEMKRESENIVSQLEKVSLGEYRLGLIAFDDGIRVLEDLNGDPSPAEKAQAMRRSIRTLRAEGGDAGPEASDEAMNTAINSLPAGDRVQEGDFTGDWKAHSRILVLITDNRPGGFDDEFIQGVDDRRALAYVAQALDKDIRISAVQVPTSGLTDAPDEEVAALMRSYAAATGGLYVSTRWAGKGTAEAILSIIKACGSNLLS